MEVLERRGLSCNYVSVLAEVSVNMCGSTVYCVQCCAGMCEVLNLSADIESNCSFKHMALILSASVCECVCVSVVADDNDNGMR